MGKRKEGRKEIENHSRIESLHDGSSLPEHCFTLDACAGSWKFQYSVPLDAFTHQERMIKLTESQRRLTNADTQTPGATSLGHHLQVYQCQPTVSYTSPFSIQAHRMYVQLQLL